VLSLGLAASGAMPRSSASSSRFDAWGSPHCSQIVTGLWRIIAPRRGLVLPIHTQARLVLAAGAAGGDGRTGRSRASCCPSPRCRNAASPTRCISHAVGPSPSGYIRTGAASKGVVDEGLMHTLSDTGIRSSSSEEAQD
jgi:hypothetical protein